MVALNKQNAETLISLIDKNKSEKLNNIHNNLFQYLKNPTKIDNEESSKEMKDLKKIFWKFPLIISSYFASQSSFLEFDQVFNPKLRGQHGAGITSLESDITNKYSNLGKNDKEIFSNMANEAFK